MVDETNTVGRTALATTAVKSARTKHQATKIMQHFATEWAATTEGAADGVGPVV